MGSWRIAIRAALSIGVLVFTCGYGVAEEPEISDPGMLAPEGAAPGEFPTTVTAANVNAAPIAGSTIGGAGSDNIRVQIQSSGPIAWTEPRHNEGDIALSIGPADPNDPSYFPPNEFVENYSPLQSDQPFANTTLAWRVNQLTGALLATVRHNGVNNGDNYQGSPVGVTHGVAYFNRDFGQGWGYRMTDGVFANGGDGSSDLQLGIAGFDEGLGEAVFDTAVAYFPYEQGWTGAWVDNGSDGEAVYSSSSEGLATSAVRWASGVATVTLPDVDSASDGMLFVAGSNSGNSSDTAAATPVDGGWNVVVREDDEFSSMGTNFNWPGNDDSARTQNSFQFLYVPYSAPGLVGGQVAGDTGSLINSAGDSRFALNRTEAGEYALSVFADDGTTQLTEDDGMLVLSVSGALADSPNLPDRTMLSYEFDSQSGDFIIQSREVAAIESPDSENVFGDLLSLRDSDFYFAFVDFANPLKPIATVLQGDYNGDGAVDAADYTVWRDSLGSTTELAADGDASGAVDEADFALWKSNFGSTGSVVASGAAVPEPAGLAIALLTLVGGLAMAKAQRRLRIAA